MILCKVKGLVIAQQKETCLVGKKLLLCETTDSKDKHTIVAVDLVGAGPGSEVLVSCHNASNVSELIDNYIVAIVDQVSVN